MKSVDRILQTWRIRKVVPYLTSASRILDIGTHDGALFRFINCPEAVGIDPNLISDEVPDNGIFIKGFFPDALPDNRQFDVIVMLAVIEHLNAAEQKTLASHCFDFLVSGGRLVLTTPAPLVDKILDILFFLKVIDGMGETHLDHYGFNPRDAIPVFSEAGLQLTVHRRFQFGLNHLLVFEKP